MSTSRSALAGAFQVDDGRDPHSCGPDGSTCLDAVIDAKDAEKPYLVLVEGRTKRFRTVLAPAEYEAIRALGAHYRATQPRPLG